MLAKKILGTVFLILLIGNLACTKKEGKIIGRVELSPELSKKIEPSAVLYVIARNKDFQKEGMTPLAVRRFAQPLVFPIEFELNQSDTMFPDTTPFQGEFHVTARIAQTGSATPIRKGDLEGGAKEDWIRVGSNQKANVIIDRVVEKTIELPGPETSDSD